jgi:hypothetical protein
MVGIVRHSSLPPTLSLSLSLAQFDFYFYKNHLEDFSLQEQLCGYRHNEEVKRKRPGFKRSSLII